MEKNIPPVEKLITNYPRLLKIEGFSSVVKHMIGRFQYPIDCLAQKWHVLTKKSQAETRAALMSVLIELVRWHARKIKKTPTIRYMNRIFRKSRCPELGYLISKLGLFDSSYNELLILAGCRLNRNYFKDN